MPRPPGIGQAELEILHYIHDHHPVTVRDVADYISRTKGHTRTTVLNVMARLVHKGYLTRRKADGVYRYEPRVPKGDLMRTMVRDFVERALGGSLSPFVAYLAEDANVSDDELRELKQLVRDLDKQQQPDAAKGAKGGRK